ncbi:unnamed protein product [Ranitomeya imitator]|uniref:Uncharacterized protein n=1 Tax=Ranitomeya imitator TaxID=111125 RepID=A0ABN9M458_9NEOB|nr:unnamed protein product [Ranitomeya imitator]
MSAPLLEPPMQPLSVFATPQSYQQSTQVNRTIRTPVSLSVMGSGLDLYQNKEMGAQLHFGFTFGFFIPFTVSRHLIFASNLKYDSAFPEVLLKKLQKEISLRRFVGIILNKESGKFHLIHHLPHPIGSSVNNDIFKSDTSFTYVSFDRAVTLIREAGQ